MRFWAQIGLLVGDRRDNGCDRASLRGLYARLNGSVKKAPLAKRGSSGECPSPGPALFIGSSPEP